MNDIKQSRSVVKTCVLPLLLQHAGDNNHTRDRSRWCTNKKWQIERVMPALPTSDWREGDEMEIQSEDETQTESQQEQHNNKDGEGQAFRI